MFNITFDWDKSMGVPGVFIIRNCHHSQFYHKKVALEDVPGHGQLQFVCNSWVYPAHRYKYDHVFFVYEDLKDRRIQVLLTLELEHQDKLCALYQEQLIALSINVEEQTLLVLTKIQEVVGNVREFKTEVQNSSSCL